MSLARGERPRDLSGGDSSQNKVSARRTTVELVDVLLRSEVVDEWRCMQQTQGVLYGLFGVTPPAIFRPVAAIDCTERWGQSQLQAWRTVSFQERVAQTRSALIAIIGPLSNSNLRRLSPLRRCRRKRVEDITISPRGQLTMGEKDFLIRRRETKRVQMQRAMTGASVRVGAIAADVRSRVVPKRMLALRKTLNYDMDVCYSTTNTYRTRGLPLHSTQWDMGNKDFKMRRA